MKNILTSKREADLISNSLSLPNSPLRNSAVFLYEDPPLMQQGNLIYFMMLKIGHSAYNLREAAWLS
jgi:hypothetical protein